MSDVHRHDPLRPDAFLFLCVRLLEWCEVDPPPRERSRLHLHADVPAPDPEGAPPAVEALIEQAEDRLVTLGPRGAAQWVAERLREVHAERWWVLLWLGGMTHATTYEGVADRLYTYACEVFGVQPDRAFHAELFDVVYRTPVDGEEAERRLQPYA